MAEKRMFAKSIVLSDAFLDMPMSARCLYFTLGMLADDDGFVGSPKAIMRQCGASQDDMLVLLQKRYLLAFESGVIVIKHWKINNYLQNDRHKSTTYLEELAMLETDSKGAYTEKGVDDICIQTGYIMDTQNSIDKNSIVEYSKEENNPPLSPKGKVTLISMIEDRHFSPMVEEVLKEWVQYKKEKHQNYKETGFSKLLTQVQAKTGEYGEQAIIDCINLSMANNWQGITWEKIKQPSGAERFLHGEETVREEPQEEPIEDDDEIWSDERWEEEFRKRGL